MDVDALLHLMGILQNARWAGAPSETEMALRYYTQELREAIRRLPEDEELLARILAEILEDIAA